MQEPPQKKENPKENEADLLSLTDEEGLEHLFQVIDSCDVGDEHYLAMLPHSEDPKEALESDATLLIMRLAEDEQSGENYFDIVENNAELSVVMRIFRPRLSALYDIDEDDLI